MLPRTPQAARVDADDLNRATGLAGQARRARPKSRGGRRRGDGEEVREPRLSRDTGPMKVVALAVAAVLWVGHQWLTNGASSAFVDQPVTYGVQQETRGLRLLDVYVAPAGGAASRGAASWRLVGALVVAAGPDDELVRATIDGRPSAITNPVGGGRVPITSSRVTDFGMAPGDANVVVPGLRIQAGIFVPVTLTFVHRGSVQVLAPVMTSLNPDG